MRLYRALALAFMVAFAVVGIVFLAAPGVVLALFDQAGLAAARQETPAAGVAVLDVGGSGLFRALAVAYMYVVTLLAWMMFRRPTEPAWPTLLAHAKLASATISILLFLLHRPYLVYAANGVVDGLIGATALVLRRQAIRARDAEGRQGARHEYPVVSN